MLFYLLGFIKSPIVLRVRELLESTKLWDFSIKIYQFGLINAIVVLISDDSYQEKLSYSNTNDIDQIMSKLLAHEQVIEKIMQYCTIFPVRFGTLFSCLKQIQLKIISIESIILMILDKLNNQEEWAVRGILDENLVINQLFLKELNKKQSELNEYTEGIRYLKEKIIRLNVKQELVQYIDKIYFSVFEDLSLYVTETYSRDPISLKIALPKKSIINWAFLISKCDVDLFKKRIIHWNQFYYPSGLELTVTGPWPAYSFVNLSNFSCLSETL